MSELTRRSATAYVGGVWWCQSAALLPRPTTVLGRINSKDVNPEAFAAWEKNPNSMTAMTAVLASTMSTHLQSRLIKSRKSIPVPCNSAADAPLGAFTPIASKVPPLKLNNLILRSFPIQNARFLFAWTSMILAAKCPRRQLSPAL